MSILDFKKNNVYGNQGKDYKYEVLRIPFA